MNLATGQVEARYEYGPFGEALRAEGGPIAQANPFRFATKFVDAETGLSYYGLRYYSAELGRWLSRDPIGESGGLNLYAMVGNDALNGIDVLGLAGNTCCKTGPAVLTRNNVWCCPDKVQFDPKTGEKVCEVAKTNPGVNQPLGGDDDAPVVFNKEQCCDREGITIVGEQAGGCFACIGGHGPSNPSDNSRTSGGGGCGEGGESSEIPFELLDWTQLVPKDADDSWDAHPRQPDYYLDPELADYVQNRRDARAQQSWNELIGVANLFVPLPKGIGGATRASTIQYSLRAADDGFYPVMSWGSRNPTSIQFLKKGDVWKFGTTRNPPPVRYSNCSLREKGDRGVIFNPEFKGPEDQARLLEKMKLINYQRQNGVLPPGNKMLK